MNPAIIIDSTATINPILASNPHIYILPTSLTWANGEVYTDTNDEAVMHDFYQRMATETHLPTTSQPQPQFLLEAMSHILTQNFDAVFCITLASGISGTFQTASLILNDYQDRIPIYMIDAKTTSFTMEHLAQTILDLATKGYSADQIFAEVNWIRDHAVTYVTIENFQNLVKGGRMSNLAAFIGTTLKIRPILYFNAENGAVTPFDKVRTNKAVYKRWLDLVDQAVLDFPNGFIIAFAHGDNPSAMHEAQAVIQQKYPTQPFRLGYLTPVLGVHGGQGSLGMAIMPKARLK